MNKKQKDKKIENNNPRRKKKMKTWKKVLLVILLLIIVLVGWFMYKSHKNGGGVSGMLATMVGHDENTKKNLPELRVLLLGVSTDQVGVDLTDTIMVASYNPSTQKASLLSIPRDTFVGKNKNRATGSEKINALYNISKDPESTLKAVNRITGLDIQYYVVVKTEALIELVDVIGGVTFNVPINMDYDDKTQDLHIHLKAGEQLLNGDKAEQLVRFRHNNNGTSYPEEYGDNDTGRMRTQREFISEVMKQTLTPGNIFKVGEILEVAHKNVITNLELSYLKDYVPYAVEFSTENLVTGTLPGVNELCNKIWIFIHDTQETEELMQKLFYNDETENSEEENKTSTNTSTNSTSNAKTVTNSEIKIEVLNGSGQKANLQQAIDDLEAQGFKVTKSGTTSTISKTIITNKKGIEDSKLKEMKQALGTGSISTNKSTTSKVDVTIVIGSDYE